jgi:hypothetical protein
MATRIADMSPRKAARVAGFGLLLMTMVAMLSEVVFGFQRFIVPGDAATTATNIMANEMLFRSGISGSLIVLLLDFVVAWALYVLLKPVNKSLSLLMAWGRLIFTTIKSIILAIPFIILELISGADYLSIFEIEQLQALGLPFLINGYNYGSSIGYVFFGVHIFVLGYLVYKSGYIPRNLGVLLIISSLGYLIDHFGKFLVPQYGAIITMVTFLPALMGEIPFMLWLLLKGIKVLPIDDPTASAIR